MLEDNPSDEKHETDLQCNAVSSVPGKEDLVDMEDNMITQKQRSEIFILALDSSLTLEDRPSDKKHETDLQSNDVSSVLLMNKKAKGTSSTKREPRVSSSRRSGMNAQKSDIESLDIPNPDKMNDATDVICETSSGQKDLVHKEDNIITEAEIQDFQSGNLGLINGSALTTSSKLSNGALES